MSLKQAHPRVINVPFLETSTLNNVCEVIRSSNKTKVLILPALYREFEGRDNVPPAMENILSVLKDSDYIDHLVIGLDAANAQQYQNVLQTLRDARLPTNIHVLWNDGPDIEKWRDHLASNAYEGRPLAPQRSGKGPERLGLLGVYQSADAKRNC